MAVGQNVEKNPEKAVRLDDLKEMVKEAWDYFKQNYESYHNYRRFVFRSAINNDANTALKEVSREPLEFNSVEALLSKLYGDFAKQEPNIDVEAAADVGLVDPELISVVEGHAQAFMTEGKNKNAQTTAIMQSVSGGFSVMKVYTDYASERSFDQNIYFKTLPDPTLCGFDPLSADKTKCDGRYSFELYPMLKKDAERIYGLQFDMLDYTRQLEGFTWSYRLDNKIDIVLICEMYLKEMKQTKIFKAADGKTYTKKSYDEMIAEHTLSGALEQPPAIIDERMTDLPTIKCYRFTEDQILEEYETDYDYLPHIFVDGNSVVLRDNNNGDTIQQFTRPLFYHALSAQKLKNVAGQVLAKEIDLTAPAKFMIDKLAIPEQYLEVWQNPQQANALIFQSTADGNASLPLPPPQAVPRIPMPPEVLQTFGMMDQMIQTILGVYPNPLSQMQGPGMGQVSGRALEIADAGNNGASMPYLVNYVESLNQVARIFINLLPKYYLTPRSIPIIDDEGKRTFQRINDPKDDNIYLTDLTPDSLNVTVTPGVNFESEKKRAFDTMIQLIQVLPAFGMFLQQKGLGVVLDNLTIRGVDTLKSLYQEFQQEMDQAKQQAQQQGAPPNPEMVKAQVAQQKMQQEDRFRAVEAALKEKELQIEQMKAILDAQAEYQKQLVQSAQAAHGMNEKDQRLMMDKIEMSHQHAQDLIENEIARNQQQGEITNESQPQS